MWQIRGESASGERIVQLFRGYFSSRWRIKGTEIWHEAAIPEDGAGLILQAKQAYGKAQR
jgi:hypothetical protein